MYSFDGSFKTSNYVSLGNSTTPSSKDVLAASRKARDIREREKTVERAAKRLQRWIKSFCCRLKLKRYYRHLLLERFLTKERSSLNESDWGTVIYLAQYFFDPKTDCGLWASLSKLIISGKFSLISDIRRRSPHGWTFYIKCIFSMCNKHINFCCDKQISVTPSLRILEVLCDPELLMGKLSSPPNFTASKLAWDEIFKTGIYRCLLTLLRAKLPSDLNMEDSEDYRRSEMYKFVAHIFKALLSLPNVSEGVAEHLLLKELYMTDSPVDQKCVFVLTCDLATCMELGKLVTALEQLLLEEDNSVSPANCTLLLHLLISNMDSFFGQSGLLDSEGVNENQFHSLVFVLATLFERYSREASVVSSAQSSLLHSDSDSEDETNGDEQSKDPMFAQLTSSISDQLTRASFLSPLVDALLACSPGHMTDSAHVHLCVFVFYLNKMYPKCRAVFMLPSKRQLMKHIWTVMCSLEVRRTTSKWAGSKSTTMTPMITGDSGNEWLKATVMGEASRGQLSVSDSLKFLPMMATFCRLMSMLLVTLDDKELFDPSNSSSSLFPFTMPQTLAIILGLKDCALGLIEVLHPDALNTRSALFSSNSSSSTIAANVNPQLCADVFKLMCKLLKQLRERDERMQFCPNPDFWIAAKCSIPKAPNDVTLCEALRRGVDLECIVESRISAASNSNSTSTALVSSAPPAATGNAILSVVSLKDKRLLLVLTCLPFCIAFSERVKLFRKILLLDKEEVGGRNLPSGVFGSASDISVNVRRTHVYEDAFEKLSPHNEPDLRKRLRVTWKNATGLDEAGIDGGGITRDFLQELVKAAFDPKLGLFAATPQGNLYPFPHVAQLMSVDLVKQHYYFVGRVIGKVLYENLLVELPLAPFFLAKILSGHVDINYLASLDQDLHQSLMSLKTFEGDMEQLALSFSTTQNVLGSVQEVELVAGGREISVDEGNKLFYMHTVADYWLNRQIKTQYIHFVSGLTDLISLKWLRMFTCASELQTLISGATNGCIDVSDMRRHTVYAGDCDKGVPFSDTHPYIEAFWAIVSQWTEEMKSALLKFITSCSRPPLLGFKELQPPIAIHSAGVSSNRLPTASVCMHVLKLPVFDSHEQLQLKLTTAIQSKSGFELS